MPAHNGARASTRRRPSLLCRRVRGWREPAHRTLVSPGGVWAAVVDRYATESSPAALVLYGPEERPVRAFTVSELLTPSEVEAQRDRTTQPDWWLRGVLLDFSLDERELRLETPDGRRLRIELATGQIVHPRS